MVGGKAPKRMPSLVKLQERCNLLVDFVLVRVCLSTNSPAAMAKVDAAARRSVGVWLSFVAEESMVPVLYCFFVLDIFFLERS